MNMTGSNLCKVYQNRPNRFFPQAHVLRMKSTKTKISTKNMQMFYFSEIIKVFILYFIY